MPVILESITNPGPDDLKDLIRLYQDYPDSLADTPETWLEDKLASGHSCFAGRFNGHLVGAVLARQATHAWKLDYLGVRAATRQHRVSRQLLTLPSQHAQQAMTGLTIESHLLPPYLIPLLETPGFRRSNNPDHNPSQSPTWVCTSTSTTTPTRTALHE